MFKYCPPPLIVLMDFLFMFLFILLYTSNTDTKISFILPDAFPSDFVASSKDQDRIKISCPQAYSECKNRQYLEPPNELRDEVAKEVFNAFLPPLNCNSLVIPLTVKINGKTWLDKKAFMSINKCLQGKD